MNRLIITTLSLLLTISCALAVSPSAGITDKYGAVVRFKGVGKTIYLIFSADSAFEGAPIILSTLAKHHAKASFFFTGNSLRMPEHEITIRQIVNEGHYVGGHSNGHLLYAEWNDERTSLVDADSLTTDLDANYAELSRFGVSHEAAPFFMPPYEWYNASHIATIRDRGITPINFSPHITTSMDYTTPEMPEYRTSQQLIDRLFEEEKTRGLDGCLLLIHPGTFPERTDKLYLRLDEIMTRLENMGYLFDRL